MANLHLIRLKHILQYNIFFIILLILTTIYVAYTLLTPVESAYSLDDTSLSGIVLDYKTDGDTLYITIKGKEKVKVQYIFKTLEEKESCQLEVGDKISLNGSFKIPEENSNFNIFNYHKYLLSNNIKYIFESTSYQVTASFPIFSLKKKFVLRIKEIDNPYLDTLILKDSSNMGDEITLYQDLNVMRLLSLSGMHFLLLYSFINKLFHRFKYKQSLTLLIFLFFFYLLPFSLSLTRFIITLIINLFLHKKPLKSLILTLIIFLIYNPFIIYNIGFIYSFTIAFFLIIFKPVKNRYLYINIIATIVSLPITIATTYSYNLLSPLITFIFMPYVTYILFPLTIINLFININALTLFLYNIMSTIISFIPSITINICTPGILILFYYLSIYETLKRHKPYIVIVITINLLIPYWHTYPIIHILNVGQGDSLLIEGSHNNTITLIDTGGQVSFKETWQVKKDPFNTASDIVIPYLKSRGINSIDYLIMTHGDNDHMGSAKELVSNFNVKEVVFNLGEDNTLETELKSILDDKKISYTNKVSSVDIGNYNLAFLNTKVYNNENDNSNVTYLEVLKTKFLFMGDASIIREEDIINKYNLSNITFLKVGHHGSDTSSSNNFIQSIKPKYALISVGKNNRYKHPKQSVLDNLKDSVIYRTDLNGTIIINTNNNGYEVETLN